VERPRYADVAFNDILLYPEKTQTRAEINKGHGRRPGLAIRVALSLLLAHSTANPSLQEPDFHNIPYQQIPYELAANYQLAIATSTVQTTEAGVRQKQELSQEQIENLQKLRIGAFLYLLSENPTHDGTWGWWSDDIPKGVSVYNNWNSHYLPDINPNVFDPKTELFSGQDKSYLKYVVEKLTEAHVDYAISSWWEENDRTDKGFEDLLDVIEAPDSPNLLFKGVPYIEAEGYADLNRDQIIATLTYIKDKYSQRESYLKIDDKPVIYVYTSDDEWFNGPANRWVEVAHELGFFVNMRIYNKGLYRFDTQPDAWHPYQSDVRRAFAPGSEMVTPRFFIKTANSPKLEDNPQEFKAALESAVEEAAYGEIEEIDVVANEAVEGTGILPQTLTKIVNGVQVEDPNGLPSDADFNVVKDVLPNRAQLVSGNLAFK